MDSEVRESASPLGNGNDYSLVILSGYGASRLSQHRIQNHHLQNLVSKKNPIVLHIRPCTIHTVHLLEFFPSTQS